MRNPILQFDGVVWRPYLHSCSAEQSVSQYLHCFEVAVAFSTRGQENDTECAAICFILAHSPLNSTACHQTYAIVEAGPTKRAASSSLQNYIPRLCDYLGGRKWSGSLTWQWCAMRFWVRNMYGLVLKKDRESHFYWHV